jgi:hypothetical protein
MPTPTFYSTPDAVIERTGIVPKDLGLADDDALETFLEGLLTQMSDLLNRAMNRDYLALLAAASIDAIPAGLTGIASDVAADALRTMVATRQTPIVRIDDFAVTTLRARVFSDDVKARLRLYGKRGLGTIGLTNR